MNEAVLENYLGNLQGEEPEYLTEGIREYIAKFNKAVLKKTTEKIHRAFTKGDVDAFESASKNVITKTKLPKIQEVKNFMGKLHEENPKFGDSVELSKKVLRNTFKIKDKAKLEILGNSIGMIGWIKSKGGKYDPLKLTRDALQDIHTKTMHIYDTGFEEFTPSTPEEEKMKEKLMSDAKKTRKNRNGCCWCHPCSSGCCYHMGWNNNMGNSDKSCCHRNWCYFCLVVRGF